MNDFLNDLNSAIGKTVRRVKNGVGSMITIDMSNEGKECLLSLWIYMSDWALTRKGDELISSDMSDPAFDSNRSRLQELLGKKVCGGYIFPDDHELHIDFDDSYRLEIWAAPEKYGKGAELAHLFEGESHISSLRGI